MGRFMIPVCCCCGRASDSWHNSKWESDGGLQDFCPEHAPKETTEYIATHFMTSTPPNPTPDPTPAMSVRRYDARRQNLFPVAVMTEEHLANPGSDVETVVLASDYDRDTAALRERAMNAELSDAIKTKELAAAQARVVALEKLANEFCEAFAGHLAVDAYQKRLAAITKEDGK